MSFNPASTDLRIPAIAVAVFRGCRPSLWPHATASSPTAAITRPTARSGSASADASNLVSPVASVRIGPTTVATLTSVAIEEATLAATTSPVKVPSAPAAP